MVVSANSHPGDRCTFGYFRRNSLSCVEPCQPARRLVVFLQAPASRPFQACQPSPPIAHTLWTILGIRFAQPWVQISIWRLRSRLSRCWALSSAGVPKHSRCLLHYTRLKLSMVESKVKNVMQHPLSRANLHAGMHNLVLLGQFSHIQGRCNVNDLCDIPP